VHPPGAQEKEGLAALAGSTAWAFPTGLAVELSTSPHSPELQRGLLVVTVGTWIAPLGSCKEPYWESESQSQEPLEILAVKL